MINFAFELYDGVPEKSLVKISYRVNSPKMYKNMTKEKKKSLVDMIDRFQTVLKATKKEVMKNKPITI